ncbi:hypothetical protein H4R35_003895 [Dimargaris xerosporica]|nr:hypothetical protein H4R35_003895 [Dimargaris xerosporica]
MSIDDDPAPTLLDSLSDSAMQIDTPKCTKPPAAWFLGTASSAPGTSSLGGGDPSLIISANPILYFKALDYLTPRELKNWALVSRHNYLLYTVYQRYVQSKLECQVMQRLGLPCSPAFTEEDGDYLPSRALFGRLLNLFEPDLDYYLFRDHYHSTWQQWNTTVEVRYLQISVTELEQELPICALIQKQQPGCNRAVLAYVGKLFACTQAIPSIGEANMARVLQHWKPLWPTAYLVSLDNQDAQSQALAMAAKQYVYRRLLPILVYSCIV